ncbi:MAG: hypothetical protein EKK34_19445 [Mycobacterium sp.]|nr:MAG: hypothetical protein EKK34_19445 [Mycobacterium sp.]
MGDLFQVDLDNLHRLGATLAGHADAIAALKITAAVEMPGSPVQEASAQVNDAVIKGFGVVGAGVRRMADFSTNAATTYEAVDRGFADQRRQYAGGR